MNHRPRVDVCCQCDSCIERITRLDAAIALSISKLRQMSLTATTVSDTLDSVDVSAVTAKMPEDDSLAVELRRRSSTAHQNILRVARAVR